MTTNCFYISHWHRFEKVERVQHLASPVLPNATLVSEMRWCKRPFSTAPVQQWQVYKFLQAKIMEEELFHCVKESQRNPRSQNEAP